MTEKIIVPELFEGTKKAIAAYKAEVEALDAQEQELNAELTMLQQELTENMLNQEGSNVLDRVHFRIRGKEISSRSAIITKILDELQEEKDALKLKYAPIYLNSLKQDENGRYPYSAKVQEIVDGYIYKMLEEIADISKQVAQQHRAISEDINEVYQDEKVNEVHRNLKYRFDWEKYKPSFFNFGKYVLDRYHIDQATNGSIHADFKNKKPKEDDSNE